MSKLPEEDKLLFEQAMQGVNPLNKSPKAPQPATKPRFTRLKKKYAQTETAPSYYDLEAIDEVVTAHQTLLYHLAGLRPQDLSRLRKGDIPIEARLDLHGHTEQVAQQRLDQFITQAYQRQLQCVLIIHGKGYNSDTQFPVIKNLVNQRLRNSSQVIAFCSAQQKDGGTGAVYVKLKSH